MAVEIGALRALLSLDSAAFEKGAKRAQASMSGLERSLSRTGARMQQIGKRMTTAVTLPIVAATGLMMRQSVQTAVEIKRMASVANAGTTEFQRFAAGAKSVGIEQDKLADILKDVNDRVGDFVTTGGGEMADFFENIAPKVGVTAEQFRNLSGPQALQLYVSSLQKAGLNQQEMTFYMEAMADEATALIPLLRNDGDEMERLGDRAQELGAIMDEKTIASLNRSNSAMRELGQVGSALSNQLTAALAPAFEALVGTLTSVAQWFAGLAPQMRTLIVVTAGVAAAIGPALIGLGLMASGLSVAIGATRALTAALFTMRGALMATGIGVAVVLAGVLANWLFKLVERTGSFSEAMGMLGDVGREVFERLRSLAAGLGQHFDAAALSIRAAMADAMAGAIDSVGAFANYIAGVAVGSKDAFIAAFKALPAALGDIMYQTANSVIEGVEVMVNSVAGAIDSFIIKANSAIPDWMKGPGYKPLGEIGKVDFGGIENKYAGAAKDAGTAVADAFGTALDREYVSVTGDALRNVAKGARIDAAAARTVGGILIDGAKGPLESLQVLRDALKATKDETAETASAAADLEAALAGVAGDGVAGGGGGAGAGGGGAGGGSGGGGGAASKVADALKEVKTEAEKAADAMKQKFDEVADSIGSAMAGAIVKGQNMGQALAQVFQQIAQDLIGSGISQMIKSLFSGMGGGGGGGIGAAIAGIFGGARANGGPVSAGRAYKVGELGEEMFVPNANGTIIPNQKLGGGGSSNVTISLAPGLVADLQGDMQNIAVKTSTQVGAGVNRAQTRAHGSQSQRFSQRGTMT